MSRSRWGSRCAVAILFLLSFGSVATAQQRGQSARPYQPSPMRPARVAQQMGQTESGGGGAYTKESTHSMTPVPDENYRGAQEDYEHLVADGEGNAGCGGNCNGGCNGNCGGGCAGNCGYGCGGSCDGGCGYCDGASWGGGLDEYGDGYSGGYYGGYPSGNWCGCDSGNCGDCCYEDAGVCCALECGQPRLSMYAEWLYLQVTDADVAHAQQQNGIGGAGTVPFGDVGTVEMEYDSGYRVGGGVGCGPCSSINFSYTQFDSDAFNFVRPPNIPGGGGAVGSLVHHPNALITASVGPVGAAYAVDYQLADVVYRSAFAGGACYTANYQLGAQYGHLEQGFVQEGNFSGGQSGTIDTYSNIDFDGGGLKAGVDAERWLGRGFSMYGRLVGTIMTGRFSSHYRMINSSTDVRLAIVDWKDDRVVPQIEYEVGMNWTSPNGYWRFAGGYMLSHWANVVTTSEFIDAVQADNYVDVDGDVTFDGLVTRVELRW